jgi:hypothetical protein
MALRCAICGSKVGQCPECGKEFPHGTAGRCDNPACVDVNAPIDCACGFVVSAGKNGVLDFDLKLHPFIVTMQ